jgi:hypothetical protein
MVRHANEGLLSRQKIWYASVPITISCCALMNIEIEDNAVIRAKADLADLNRKIGVIKNEEDRLATQRQGLESDRNRVLAFIEMYQKYTAPLAGAEVDRGEHAQSEASKPNGADHPTDGRRRDRVSARNSRKRCPPVHKKPPGTPTTNEMIFVALRDAQERGLPGLAPKGITAFIRQKWWPHLKGAAVGSAAWRLYQDKQIRKEGDFYALRAS